MRKFSLLILMTLVATGVAMAQTSQDVLGAHNGYGRGCVMCHAPHSGSLGNGKTAPSTDPQNGMFALWGQDLSPLYGKTFNFSGDNKATYAVTLPSAPVSAHDANTVILFCLSCHDGALTSVGMMKGQTVETLPIVGGTAPTLLAKAAPAGGTAYQNDHPVGQNAIVGCGGQYNWDCTGGGNTSTPVSMSGTASQEFLTNYKGSFWNSASNPLATFGTTVNAVTCTTCHDQHSMTKYTNSNGSFDTMFFVRGQYTPNTNGNSVSQFCRNCHGGESNEMHGLTNVPTI